MGENDQSKHKIVNQVEVYMTTRVVIKRGDKLFFPYNIYVAGGEPSAWRNIHDRYCKQFCEVVKISIEGHCVPRILVRFKDGFEHEMAPHNLVVGMSEEAQIPAGAA